MKCMCLTPSYNSILKDKDRQTHTFWGWMHWQRKQKQTNIDPFLFVKNINNIIENRHIYYCCHVKFKFNISSVNVVTYNKGFLHNHFIK